MATDYPVSGECNTPWWYETPSLISQTSHLMSHTGSTDSNPFDITPSVSSGYFDEEEDGSNVSEGSFPAHYGNGTSYGPNAFSHHRTESNWSTSTLTGGSRQGRTGLLSSQQQGDYNDAMDHTPIIDGTCGTLEAVGESSNYTEAMGEGGGALREQEREGGEKYKVHSRGIPVGPLEIAGERPLSDAFMAKGVTTTYISESGVPERRDYENAMVGGGENNLLSHSMSSANQEILHYLAPQLLQNIHPMDLIPHLQRFDLLNDSDIDFVYNPSNITKDKIKRIILEAPTHDGNSFERFVDCLECDGNHSSHVYLAKRFREAMEKKKMYPFKRLSSMRQKSHHTHNHAHNHAYHAPARPPQHGDMTNRRASDPKKTTPSHHAPMLPPPSPSSRSSVTSSTSEEEKPMVPPKLRRRNMNHASHSSPGGIGAASSPTSRTSGASITYSSGGMNATIASSPTSRMSGAPTTYFSGGMNTTSNSTTHISDATTTYSSGGTNAHSFKDSASLSQSLDLMPQHDTPDGGRPYFLKKPSSGIKKRSPHYDASPGNFSSLPRTNSQGSDISRGTKPYSSARYSTNTIKFIPEPIMENVIRGSDGGGGGGGGSLSLKRNVSFHGSGIGGVSGGDHHIIVSPIDRNPAVLSEETEDDSYLFRKGTTSRETRSHSRSNYQNVAILPGGPLGSHSLPRRTHEVIMEDSRLDPESPRSSTSTTFPRRVPGRSHSMNIQGDNRIQSSLPREGSNWAQSSFSPTAPGSSSNGGRKGGTSVRRGGSFCGATDYRTSDYNTSDYNTSGNFTSGYVIERAGAGNVPSSTSISVANNHQQHQQHHQHQEERADQVMALLPPPSLRRPHRRTQSFDNSSSTSGGQVISTSSEDMPRRRASEYYPPSDETTPIIVEEAVMPQEEVLHGATEQKMKKKKFQWLQQKVKFTDFCEEVHFDSETRYHVPREILYSGTLFEKGKPRFVILLTDMILVIKPKKKVGRIASRLGASQQYIDWFTEIECKAKRPLMLHLLSLQQRSWKESTEFLGIHYSKGVSLVKINLQTVSKEAKNIWTENLNAAIGSCTRANAECTIPVQQNAPVWEEENQRSHPRTKLSLTIIEANNIAYSSNITTKNHYCAIRLGRLQSRTPSVKAKCWPIWNYDCEFSDFELHDDLQIHFYTEQITSPDDFLGYVEVNLLSAAQKHETKLGVSQMQLKKQHLPLKEGKGTLTVNFELQWTKTE